MDFKGLKFDFWILNSQGFLRRRRTLRKENTFYRVVDYFPFAIVCSSEMAIKLVTDGRNFKPQMNHSRSKLNENYVSTSRLTATLLKCLVSYRLTNLIFFRKCYSLTTPIFRVSPSMSGVTNIVYKYDKCNLGYHAHLLGRFTTATILDAKD